jgi:hypothetical protein
LTILQLSFDENKSGTMEQEIRQLIGKIHNHLCELNPDRINLLEVCKTIGCELNEISKLAPTPQSLIKQILDYRILAFSEVLDFEKYESEGAVDSMIISGQEIFEHFEQLSPSKYIFVFKLNPELYQSHLTQLYGFIEKRLTDNLEKGILKNEYKADLDKSLVINKYIDRIKTIHSQAYSTSETYSFANIFSNIFEDYLEEVATEENWHYFRKRKQFYEAISFANR